MRKNNLLKILKPLEDDVIAKEHNDIDMQYIKLLDKLETIIVKIKEKRTIAIL